VAAGDDDVFQNSDIDAAQRICEDAE